VGSGQAKKQKGLSVRIMVPFFFVFLMFVGTVNASQHLLTSVIEEKNSRVVELILSSVSPFQFMAGKILGLAAIGLGAVCFWGLVAYGAATYRGLVDIVTTTNVAYFLVYFILGFLLFSSVFVAIGSACNTLKEAQSLMMPVMLFLVVPMMAWMYFSQHPNAPWTVGLSFVPPLTPMVMMLRLAARPAMSVPLVMWAAARIFRVGILMYGKPASPRELFRWLRAK
jgi:ABC-type Na+ efflux pump permease subunit